MNQQEKDALIELYVERAILGNGTPKELFTLIVEEVLNFKDEWYDYPAKAPELDNMIPGDPWDGWCSDWLVVKGDFMGYKIGMLEFNPYEDATLWKDQEGNLIKSVHQWKHITPPTH